MTLDADGLSAPAAVDQAVLPNDLIPERGSAVRAPDVHCHVLLALRARLGNRRLRVLLGVLLGHVLPTTSIPVVLLCLASCHFNGLSVGRTSLLTRTDLTLLCSSFFPLQKNFGFAWQIDRQRGRSVFCGNAPSGMPGLITIYRASDREVTPDVVGMSSTVGDNFGGFPTVSTGFQEAIRQIATTWSL